MSIVPGQAVSASTDNAAFLSRLSDSSTIAIVDFLNTAIASGAGVYNIQRAINSLCSALGISNAAAYNFLITWASADIGSASSSAKDKIDALVAAFNVATGHAHDGSTGAGGYIQASSIQNPSLVGKVIQGTDVLGVTGSSVDVTSQFTLATPSTGITVEGVVANNPVNRIVIRQASGANEGDSFVDGSGNVVYGRLVYSGGPTWTIYFYVDISGTETAYSFASSSDIRFYYQQLVNPLTTSIVYSEFAVIPSDNITADVVDATTSQRGVVSTSTQSFGGNKSFANNLTALAGFLLNAAVDSTTTGANASATFGNIGITRFTNASLTSLDYLTGGSANQVCVLMNNTGNTVTVTDNAGSDGFLTGTGQDFTWENDASILLVKNSSNRWTLIGGGGGANTALSNLASTAVNTDIIPANDNSIDLGSSVKYWKDIFVNLINNALKVGSVNVQWWGGSTFGVKADSSNAQVQADGGIVFGSTDAASAGENTAEVGLATGSNVGNPGGASAPTGSLYFATGDVDGDVNTGSVYFNTGAQTGSSTTNTGGFNFTTGYSSSSSNTGPIGFGTGDNAGSGPSGAITFNTGNTVTGNSGDFAITTGVVSGAGNSGNMIFTTGSAGGTRGYVQFDAERLQLVSGKPLRFWNVSGSNFVQIQPPTSLSNQTYTLPAADGSSGQVLQTNGAGVLSWVNNTASTWNYEALTLSAGDITNQYKDLAQVAVTGSIDFYFNGLWQRPGVDYTINYTGGAGGKTRLTFAGDIATGGGSALVSGDIIHIKYQY